MDTGMESYIVPIREFVKRHKPQKGLEVGLYKGYSARAYLESCQGELVSVDLNDDYQQEEVLLKEYPSRFKFVQTDSSTYMRCIVPETLDYIYIDGDHRYNGIKKDIEAALPLLKEGGVLLIDDYEVDSGPILYTGQPNGHQYGVKKAVDELLSGYKRIDEDIRFANGAVAFKK